MDKFLQLENRHTGEILRMRRVRDSQGQTILNLEGSLPPRADGSPLHVHFHEREEGVVREGTVGVRVGKHKTVVQAGGAVVLPAGVVHNWWNAGDEMLVFSGQTMPVVDLDRYLQAVFAVLNASSSGKPSIFYIAHVSWRHRRTQALAMPPRAIQRIIFPLVVFVGRVLGKYRGDNWPGSPESCMGAGSLSTGTPHVRVARFTGPRGRERCTIAALCGDYRYLQVAYSLLWSALT